MKARCLTLLSVWWVAVVSTASPLVDLGDDLPAGSATDAVSHVSQTAGPELDTFASNAAESARSLPPYGETDTDRNPLRGFPAASLLGEIENIRPPEPWSDASFTNAGTNAVLPLSKLFRRPTPEETTVPSQAEPSWIRTVLQQVPKTGLFNFLFAVVIFLIILLRR
jgi:hypothetical protein